MRKNTLNQRLNIIKGQIDGLARIINEKGTCRKAIEQFQSVNSGLKKVIELYLKENLEACFQSINSKEKEEINFILGEVIKLK